MRKNLDLINGEINKTLIKFSIPLAISFIINIIYSWVDLFFVSRIGDLAVGAVGTSERILFFLFAVGSGLAIGSSVIVARRIGEGNIENAKQTAIQSLFGMLIIGILLSLLFFISKPLILNLLGIKNEIKVLASKYFDGLVLGIAFNLIIFQNSMIMRSLGNTFYPMQILIISNIINAIFTPLLIFGIYPFPRLEVFGAGLGTSISQILGAFWGLYILLSKFHFFEVKNLKLKLDFKEIFKIIKIGLPASLQLITVSIASIGLTANANYFSSEILSTYVIGLRIDLFINMSIFAFGAAIEIITGQNLGANKIKRIFEFHKSAIISLIKILMPLSLLSFFFGKYIGYIFTNNIIIINNLDIYLKIVSFSNIPFAIGIISLRVISGSGDYFRSLKVVFSVLIFTQLPLAFVLSYIFNNPIAIWISILISMIILSISGYISLIRLKWLRKKI